MRGSVLVGSAPWVTSRPQPTPGPGGFREDQGSDPVGGRQGLERRGDRARSAQGRARCWSSWRRPGMCHSDEHLVTGDLPFELPDHRRPRGRRRRRGGRARASAGCSPATTSCSASSRRCGRCPSCSTGHQNLCDLGAAASASACRSPTARRATTPRAQDLGLMCLLGTFSHHTVVNEASCIKIDDDVPLDRACLLGCGVVTGWGSAVYAAEVAAGRHGGRRRHRRHRRQRHPGRQARRRQAASSPSTRSSSSARRRWSSAPPTPRRRSRRRSPLIHGHHLGHDGQQGHHDDGRRRRRADRRRRWRSPPSAAGSSSPTSTRRSRSTATMSLLDLTLMEKQVVGSLFGSGNPRDDIPKLLGLYREGQLDLDGLVTKTYPLDERQRGLRGHARRQEHPRRHGLRLTSTAGTARRPPPVAPLQRAPLPAAQCAAEHHTAAPDHGSRARTRDASHGPNLAPTRPRGAG